jgi:hypothetical protein
MWSTQFDLKTECLFFCIIWLITLKRGMDTLPVELQALILTADFATWTAAVQTLGRITVQPYVQSYARRQFLRSHTNSIGVISYLLMDDMSTRHGYCSVAYHDSGFGDFGLCRTHGNYHRGKLHGYIMYVTPYTSEQEYFRHALYYNGKLHNDHGPAMVVFANSSLDYMCWYHHGQPHRDHLPAEIHFENNEISKMIWFNHGKLHRVGGPAMIITFRESMLTHGYGVFFHYVSAESVSAGKIRRDCMVWMQNNQIHRPLTGPDNGPAIIHTNGTMEYYVHGEFVS